MIAFRTAKQNIDRILRLEADKAVQERKQSRGRKEEHL